MGCAFRPRPCRRLPGRPHGHVPHRRHDRRRRRVLDLLTTVLALVGPGVVQAGAVDGLRALAAERGLGVANTWGAKGVFEWTSPHHLGTVGLQARDWELSGLHAADLVVVSGIDPAETRGFAPKESRVVEPDELGALAVDLPKGPPMTVRPPLYERLAALYQRLSHVEGSPAHAVAVLRASVGPGTVVVAEPGIVGLWVARMFPTTELGSVIVPATTEPGVATRVAAEHEASGRRVVFVNAERWADVDFSYTDELIDVAGPVIAWGGI